MIINNKKMLLLLEASDVERFYKDETKKEHVEMIELEIFNFRRENTDFFRILENQKFLNLSQRQYSPERVDIALAFSSKWNMICKNIYNNMKSESLETYVESYDYNGSVVVPIKFSRINFFDKFKKELSKSENSFEINLSQYPPLCNSFIEIFKDLQGAKQKVKIKEAFLLSIFPKKELISYFQNEGRKERYMDLFYSLQVDALNDFIKNPNKSNEEKESYIDNAMNARRGVSICEPLMLCALKNYIQFNHQNGTSLDDIKSYLDNNKKIFNGLDYRKIDTLIVKEFSALGEFELKNKFTLDLTPSDYTFTFKLPLSFDKNLDLPINRKTFLKSAFIKSLEYYLENVSENSSLVNSLSIDLSNHSLCVYSETIEGLNTLKLDLKKKEKDFLNFLLPNLLSEVSSMFSNSLSVDDASKLAQNCMSVLDTLICADKIEKALSFNDDIVSSESLNSKGNFNNFKM